MQRSPSIDLTDDMRHRYPFLGYGSNICLSKRRKDRYSRVDQSGQGSEIAVKSADREIKATVSEIRSYEGKILSYDEAFQELDEIHSSLINVEVPVDVLAKKLKRTAFLVNYCKEKLQSADRDASAIISEMELDNGKTNTNI